MASEKIHHGDELAKPSAAVECEVTASQLRSLVDANISSSNVTLDDNRRILRKLDMWSVFLPLDPSPRTKYSAPGVIIS